MQPTENGTDPPLMQRSMAWFSARIGKINASELDKVLGFGYGRNEARMKLFDNLRNHTAPESFSNDATQWGQTHETEALEAYVKHCTFATFRPQEHGGKTHPTYEWLRASPDALLFDEEGQLAGLVEIKCPYRLRDQPPPAHDSTILTGYILQMNLQMEVYDVPFCDFVQWTPQGFTARRIHRNPNLFAYVLPLYEDFYIMATKTDDEYQRLDPSVVAHTQQRVNDLYSKIESTRFETIVTS